ncbi:hypothetical protein C0992_006431 [Termitomyces sp. T32_za158]|nr:hypothetical protein C0992_006431 [Termitomyces sp. T32_za158]
MAYKSAAANKEAINHLTNLHVDNQVRHHFQHACASNQSFSQGLDNSIDTQLVEPPYLHKLGIAYNTMLPAFVCLICGIVIQPSHIVEHIKNKHTESGIVADRELIAQDVQLYGLSDQLPSMDLTPRPAFQGLTMHTALKCIACPKIYVARSSMIKHHNIEHKGIPVPSSWPAIHAQQLNHALYKSFFPVIPPAGAPVPHAQAIIDNIEAAMLAIDGKPSGHRLDPRLVSPWLKSNRWLELIKDKPIHELRAMVAPLQPNEFSQLVPAVHRLFQGSEDMFDLVPELILQRLNTPDPAKT